MSEGRVPLLEVTRRPQMDVILEEQCIYEGRVVFTLVVTSSPYDFEVR